MSTERDAIEFIEAMECRLCGFVGDGVLDYDLGFECSNVERCEIRQSFRTDLDEMEARAEKAEAERDEANRVSHEWLRRMSDVRYETLDSLKSERDALEAKVERLTAALRAPCDCGFTNAALKARVEKAEAERDEARATVAAKSWLAFEGEDE